MDGASVVQSCSSRPVASEKTLTVTPPADEGTSATASSRPGPDNAMAKIPYCGKDPCPRGTDTGSTGSGVSRAGSAVPGARRSLNQRPVSADPDLVRA